MQGFFVIEPAEGFTHSAADAYFIIDDQDLGALI